MLYATFQNLMLGGKYRQTSDISRTKYPNLNVYSSTCMIDALEIHKQYIVESVCSFHIDIELTKDELKQTLYNLIYNCGAQNYKYMNIALKIYL